MRSACLISLSRLFTVASVIECLGMGKNVNKEGKGQQGEREKKSKRARNGTAEEGG